MDVVSPEDDLSEAVAPEASTSRWQPEPGNLDYARGNLDAPHLGATQSRGKGGGGEGSGSQPPGSPPVPPVVGPVVNHAAACKPCNCRCEPIKKAPLPEGMGGAPITPLDLWGPGGPPTPLDSGPLVLATLRAPPMSGMGVGSERELSPAQIADGGLELPIDLDLVGRRPAGLEAPREMGSAVVPIEDMGDGAFELELLGADLAWAHEQGDLAGVQEQQTPSLVPTPHGASVPKPVRRAASSRATTAAATPPQYIDPSQTSRRTASGSLDAPTRGTRAVKGPPGSSLASARTPPQGLLA